MNHEWLDDYIEAWEVHPHAGGPAGAADLARLLVQVGVIPAPVSR